MTLTATVIDPLTEPVPAAWDTFAEAHRLRPGWHSGPLRAIDWCVPIASSMVVVTGPADPAPVGIFHARHFGLGDPGRFVTPGRVPRLALIECRTAPVPAEAGLSFAAGTDQRDRMEAVRAFERALRRRTGPGAVGIGYRNLLEHDLPAVGTGGRLRRLPPRMVLPNQWSDLDSYLASVPAKWRSQLKKLHHEVTADATVRVELADTIEPAQACWLAEVIRQRYTPRTPPRPPLSAHAIAQIARLPGTRFLTYRGPGGRLLGYSAIHDNGTELQLIWWGSRGGTDGWRGNLYFDQYLRLVELMIELGRSRLILGAGMEQIKARYGARPQQRWSLVRAPLNTGGRSGRRPAREPRQPAREPGRRRGGPLLRRLWTWLGRSPDRAHTAAECRQCGRWASVNVLRLSTRHARYWCERCGAVVSLRGRSQLRALRPVRLLRTATADRAPRPPAGAGAGGHPGLHEFMPPAMVRWMRPRSRPAPLPDPRDKSQVYQRYQQWDAHLRRLGPAGAAGLAAPGEPPPCPGLPPFSRVVGALHDGCYRVDRVAEQLQSTVDLPPEVTEQALRERVEHARRWLARHGRSLCWVHSRLPEGGPAVPDRGQVEAALASLRAGSLPGPETGRAARTALFGTDGGPALSTLLRAHSTGEVVAALVDYLDTGARPLREEALSRLTVPPAAGR